MRSIRLIPLALVFYSAAMAASAMPEKLPVEVWADTMQVRSLDMSPDAQRMAMLMRRERGGDPELLIFDTDDIRGTLQAIQPEGLIPTALRWANNDVLVVNFTMETEQGGRPVYLSRSASYHVETEEWTSLIRTTSRRDVRGTGSQMMGELGIGRVVSILPDEPRYVLIAHNEEPGKAPNFYKVDIESGERSLVLKGNSRFDSYIWDRQGNARGASEYDERDNAIVAMARMSSEDDWTEVGRQRAENRNRFGVLGFYDPERPYTATILADDDEDDFAALYDVDIRSGERELVFGTQGYDAQGVILSPRLADGTRVVGYTYSDPEGIQQYFIDEGYGALYKGLQQAFPKNNVNIERVSEDGQTTLVRVSGPQNPGTWYLVSGGQVAPVIRASNEIMTEALSPVDVIEYEARDGLKITGYVTVPAGAEGPFPTIAMPHGGPWVRDTYGFDRWAQMLANRGYAVFQPNYRGSTQFGKAFWIAGDNKWGHEMQDDIEDGMKALVERGIADPEKLAIFGWSYGGYAAYVAATRDNDFYNCVVSGAGVSDLSRIRGGISGNRFLRQYQKPTISGVSPINEVENVSVPMLIVHGDYDSTVPVEHSRRFVDGLERIGADHEYIEIEDMGHSPFLFEQNMEWFPSLFEFFDRKCSF